MIYLENSPVSAQSLADLRQSVKWNRMEKCLPNITTHSYYHICVFDHDLLIGYIDCISNGTTDAYIQDLIVHPDYQNQGIGTELMRRTLAFLKSKKIYMISILYNEALRPFYRRFGFTEMLGGQLQTYECE